MRDALHGHSAQITDSLLAVALFAAGLWELLARPFADDVVEGPLALNIAALAVATLPLAARRLAPLAVAVSVFAAIGVRALVADPLEVYPRSWPRWWRSIRWALTRRCGEAPWVPPSR